MFSLNGKVAIITGAGEGIGRHIALAFARQGASVVALDIKDEAIRETERQIAAEVGAGRVLALGCDISTLSGVNETIAACIERFGRLNCIVHNAANQTQAALEDETDEHWQELHEVNVMAALRFAREGLPHLLAQPGSAIVHISSLVADMAMPGRLAYNTSKTALLGLTRALAVELGPRGVRVNAICPGHIMSQGEEKWKAQHSESEQKIMKSSYALGRVGKPQEVAAAAVFLASDAASFITGETLRVDGGMSILNPETSVHRAAEL